MRIHTDKILERATIVAALIEGKELGRIAEHVTFKRLTDHESRSHVVGWEIQLEASERDNGRRAGNSGSYGAMRPEVDGYAATFDEWGWLLAALFERDPGMVVGSPKHPTYANKADFDRKTALTYAPDALLGYLVNAGYDPYPIVVGKAARTKRGYFVGRRGASRVDSQPSYWPGKVAPRTPDEVRAFAWPRNAVSA